MPRTSYTAAEKARALRRCDEIGVTKTSKETGITMASLYVWRHAANEGAVSPTAADLAGVPTGDETAPKKNPRQPRNPANAQIEPGEELIRLRVENAALKAQVLSLKNAVRAFAE